MVVNGAPHALLLAGPPSTGKTTLALDLAAGLLCASRDPATRPCRSCRSCRMVESGNHPDLHRIVPDGPGGQIRIDAVRRLVGELALLPVEGGARVAVVEAASRLNEDAQNTLLKTLEEPPTGVTIVLCADEEERLLPTVRSRCAKLRLGPVAAREIEELLAGRGAADPPLAARLARLAGGRPGLAIAYAGAPEAIVVRGELARGLLDLLGAGRHRRLGAIRDLLARAGELGAALAGDAIGSRPTASRPASSRAARARAAPADAAAIAAPEAAAEAARVADDAAAPSAAGRAPASERRRGAAMLLEVWRDLVHDLALARAGELRGLRDPGLLDELAAVGPRLPKGEPGWFLARLARTGELLEANVAPELALDVLVLAWPHVAASDAA